MSETRSGDLVRGALQLLALVALLVASFWIVRPFLLPGIWAAMIAVAAWPLLLRAQAGLGGRSRAVVLLTAILLLVVLVPLYVGIRAVVANVGDVAHLAQGLAAMPVPQPPSWLDGLPLFGAQLATSWRELANETPAELAARVTPYARQLARWLVAEVGGIGLLLVQFLLTTVIAAILFANGERAADGAQRFARRLAGPQGEKAVLLAGQAIRAVALGVIVTAAIQTFLVGLGLVVADVPFAAILIALSFVLAIAQIGPIPVLIGAVIWVYAHHGGVWGTVFLVWAALCGVFDNFARPILIRRGADLPLLLIFAGVIGGLLAFGVIGLFVGPVVLAVGYMLLADWMSEAA